jgi:hypothetical protein
MINWAFISSLEGHRLAGYVPDEEDSVSGVTVADGVDLGQLPHSALATLPSDVRALVEPYVGLRRQDAANALKARPLILSELQAAALDTAVRAPFVRALAFHFDEVVGPNDAGFGTIPDACQTVIASVAWQYGTPWARCPRFWEAATRGDWEGVYDELMNFGDAYEARRRTEAQYLKSRLGFSGE